MELTADEATIRERLMKRENGVGLYFLSLHVNLDEKRAISCCSRHFLCCCIITFLAGCCES